MCVEKIAVTTIAQFLHVFTMPIFFFGRCSHPMFFFGQYFPPAYFFLGCTRAHLQCYQLLTANFFFHQGERSSVFVGHLQDTRSVTGYYLL